MTDNIAATGGDDPPFFIEMLNKTHDRSAFFCGSEPLERYFKMQAGQDVRKRVAKCSVLVEASSGEVCGFYTMSATSIMLSSLPKQFTKGLPRYPTVPSVLIGRLAVATNSQGKNMAKAMIAHAVEVIVKSPIGVFAIVVDAKDDAARAFYQRQGFASIDGHENRLILSVAAAIKAFDLERPLHFWVTSPLSGRVWRVG